MSPCPQLSRLSAISSFHGTIYTAAATSVTVDSTAVTAAIIASAPATSAAAAPHACLRRLKLPHFITGAHLLLAYAQRKHNLPFIVSGV